ncbi:peptidase M24 [Paenibacillus cisolokensis]|uniref:Peptidase M24 n=1 Tax=Paenibacillus cisolokensis TaxID=1658519 RepID=A0ABQ4N993_9BACL|nr:Xaa-Pro peptidase family protein [Paenibacillus cisolokensis]GIQ64760.1 peptidase M24 [Paenibacillus cisolokensis]
MIEDQYRIPREEVHGRIVRLQQALRREGYDGLLLTQNVDILYATGSMQTGYAVIPAEGEAVFYVRRSLTRAARESAVRTAPLGSLRGFRAALERDCPQLFAAGGGRTLAADLDTMPAQTYLRLLEALRSGEAASAPTLADGSALVRRVRAVKTPWEIARIERAARIVSDALTEALNDLREGVTELAWMARLEYELRIRGHIGMMRVRGYNQEIVTGMVGSGAAAAEPSAFDGPAGGRGLGPAAAQGVSGKTFARDEPILIDIGCCVDGYVIDQTRTAVIGALPDDLAEAYKRSEAILQAARRRMVPGVRCSALYQEALRLADESGWPEHFMGFGADRVKFLGHGIGLEVGEWPVLANGFDDPLEPGMTVAVEPKFAFPGRGVVGVEDTYLVTEGGPRPLTCYPEGLIVLP